MTPKQRGYLERALGGLVVEPFSGLRFDNGSTFLDWARSKSLSYASISFTNMVATGFSRDGARAIAQLADSVRKGPHDRTKTVSKAALSVVIANEIVAKFRARSAASLTDQEISDFEHAIELWFAAQSRMLRHLVPCNFIPGPLTGFAVGPVKFFHMNNFNPEDYGVDQQPAFVDSEPGGIYFNQMFKLMAEQSATWVAEVAVVGREKNQSVVTADFAVDIALGGLQSLIANPEFHNVARATARSRFHRRVDILVADDHLPISHIENRTPGRAIDRAEFANFITKNEKVLDSIGRRLSSYLANSGTTPNLDRAWCEAAYWYHEALAETLDTVRIAKLETAMEVLLGAKSTKQSNARLLDAFEAFFGLAPDDQIDQNSSLLVKHFIESVVIARSRVLHGTWPTLTVDPPSVTFASVDNLARNFLILFAIHLDVYIETGRKDDNTRVFLSWVKVNRLADSNGA